MSQKTNKGASKSKKSVSTDTLAIYSEVGRDELNSRLDSGAHEMNKTLSRSVGRSVKEVAEMSKQKMSFARNHLTRLLNDKLIRRENARYFLLSSAAESAKALTARGAKKSDS